MFSMASAKKGRGKPDVFNVTQNRALRAALKELRRQYPTQAALATVLEIKQQNVGRLLAEKGGFAYGTATRLVRLLGFAGVDAFFADRGVTLSPSSLPPAFAQTG